MGNENSAQSFFWPKFLKMPWGRGRPRLRVMDVRAQMLVFFSRISRALTEVSGRDIRANDPRMSVGYPSAKLPLWADFSFLNLSSSVWSRPPPIYQPWIPFCLFHFPADGCDWCCCLHASPLLCNTHAVRPRLAKSLGTVSKSPIQASGIRILAHQNHTMAIASDFTRVFLTFGQN